ncbi:cAMP-specific 3',5'-cyclic phosphodiesterase 4C [Physocladia obscura]|uniref:Phosphodiesterase n=1 Tax=Physocladia obscura TaxID=109957 RepID=A0AAD5XGE0_9FUNG|nr:cAMP-specific 3',5'-cyclic phosphodiesterase 4C [Physocladia obscura]
MSLEEFQNVFPTAWINLSVSVIGNSSFAISAAENAAINGSVAGFIGDATYFETVDIANRFNIPICEGLDDRDTLSDHNAYPMFFRTIPSVSNQINAILSFILSQGWTNIVIVTSANFSVNIQKVYALQSPLNLTECTSVATRVASSIIPGSIIVYFGVPNDINATCFKTISATVSYNNGYSWIIDDETSNKISVSISSLEGIFGFTIREGNGNAYEAFLNNWRNSSYQRRFYRTCLQLMLVGYAKIISSNKSTVKALSQGFNSGWTSSVSVPGSFQFEDISTVTGNVQFLNGTGDRKGFFVIKYYNGSNAVTIGNFNESENLSIDNLLLSNLGWTKPKGPVSASEKISFDLAIAISIIGTLVAVMLLYSLHYFYKKYRKNEHKSFYLDFGQDAQNSNQTGILRTGQQALGILRRMKHSDQPTLTKVEIDIITDALTSGDNTAYNPQFDVSRKSGSAMVDHELQEFLMSTMLAQTKRNTGEASSLATPFATRDSAQISEHLKPEMRRKKSVFQGITGLVSMQVKRPGSVNSDVGRSSSPALPSPVSNEIEPVFSPPSQRNHSLHGNLAKTSIMKQTNDSEDNTTNYSRTFNDCGNIPSPATGRTRLAKAHTVNSKKYRAASMNSHEGSSGLPSGPVSIHRRISAFAQAFTHQTSNLNAPQPSAQLQSFKEDDSLLELVVSIPDINKKYEDFDVLLKPAVDVGMINSKSVFDYLSKTYLTWNIDMFRVCKLSEGHPLYFSGVWLIEKTDLLQKFRIDNEKFKKWLLLMESEYRPLPYHNCIHASDVLQSFNFIAFNGHWASKFTPIEKLSGIVAAIGHDIDHPGLSNQFLVKARDPIAIMYSDASVNEFHHSAHMFTKTLASPFNIFSELSSDEFEEMRRVIVKLILATDMGKHFEILSKFQSKIEAPGFQALETQENRLMVLELALKCSDLSNPSKPYEVSIQWSQCVMEEDTAEFYRQGDREKALGLPVSNFMDRSNPNVAKCQLGFIDFLVAPLFATWATFNRDDINNVIMKTNIAHNRKLWQCVVAQNDAPSTKPVGAPSTGHSKSLSSFASSLLSITSTPAVPNVPEIFVMKTSVGSDVVAIDNKVFK